MAIAAAAWEQVCLDGELVVPSVEGPFGLEGIASTPSAKRQRLYKHIEAVPGIKIIEHIDTQGEPLFRAIVDGDHEGIVAKRMDAPYRTGPHNARLKIKNRAYSRREAVE